MPILHLLDSILQFVKFWAGHLALPLKRQVDASIHTYTRKKIEILIQLASGNVDANDPFTSSTVNTASTIANGGLTNLFLLANSGVSTGDGTIVG